MELVNQIITLLIDKLFIGILILISALFINKSLEKYKNNILRSNKVRDIKYEKISNVIEKIWSCNQAFNKMLADFAKSQGDGPFQGISEIMEEDKEKFHSMYIESSADFSASVSDLNAYVNSSKFWLGEGLFNNAKRISQIYYDIILGIINSNASDDMEESISTIEVKIHDFEEAATKYIGFI